MFHLHGLCLPAIATIAAFATGSAAFAADVDAKRLLNAKNNNAEWVSYGRTYDEQRFSPLTRIDQNTVKNLALAWYFDMDTNRGQEATPLVIDGTMYFTSAWSKAYAVDARTGKEKWRYDPQVEGGKGIDACCDVVNRGVAAWGNQVFLGTLDNRLIALDMATGKPTWTVATAEPGSRYTITGAPRVIRGKVLIGNGGAEMGVRGFITAYDAATGKQLWRFYTVPGDPKNGFESPALEKAVKTWNGEWWKYGGGGTVWDAMAYDPELDLLYIGTGNGSPWNHRIRSNGEGDNLYLSSIVALKPDTGEYVWHFQTTPGESWDFTATQHIILADLTINGKLRKVLMQAPKNGFFYVLDRKTGEFISGRNYVNVTWTTGLDPKTGRPHDIPEARYLEEPAQVAPGPVGAHNWYPMAFSPLTKLVYVPALESSSFYSHDENFSFNDKTWNIGISMSRSGKTANASTVAAAAKSVAGGFLLAWDPVQQREVWRVPYQRAGNGGLLATAGNLVFQGSSDNNFYAYRADTGEKLWEYGAQNGIIAAPMTYELDGEQYLVALAGMGGVAMGAGGSGRTKFGRVLAFKIGGKAMLPALEGQVTRTVPDLSKANPTGNADKGASRFESICIACHGAATRAVSSAPDLRYSKAIADSSEFKKIVIDGSLTEKGMVSFGTVLSPLDAEDIRSYLVSEAQKAAAAGR
jgi:quinohemoprotein ethanol dehydrogenase